ncbi:MAG: M48 family metalloprotease [Thiobacillus sp.]|nr:M48 family metalloprotease [Thiobacillus sp.]
MKRALTVLLVCALAASVEAAVTPRVNATRMSERAPDETSLWHEADAFDQALARAGKINSDPALTAYLQGIMDRLYPEFKGRLRVHLLNAQHINAFALPNGSVYVNAGLIARFQNEAQLATVMAHEGAHFTHRHSLQQAEQAKNASAFALVVAMLGVPLVGDLVALSSMLGYSQEHERQADEIGYQRLLAAGYDPRESVRAFEQLLAEVKAADIQEPFFFASHPKLQERIDHFSELSKNANGGETARERYLDTTAALRLGSLDADLAAYRYKQLILVLADPERRREYPPEAAYYLGEAYRQRGETGDAALAEAEYRSALQAAPQFAPSYRALGLLLYKRGDKALAAPLLQRYLELAPDAPDCGHIEHYLKALSP